MDHPGAVVGTDGVTPRSPRVKRVRKVKRTGREVRATKQGLVPNDENKTVKATPVVSPNDFSFEMFNKEQMAAVNHGEGPMTVYAAPGSGKTFAMIGRIVKLVQRGESQHSIMTTTFTKDATRELKDRLKTVGIEDVTVSTMHSFCYSLMRQSKAFEGWQIDDQDKYKRILKDVISYKQMKWSNCDISALEQFIAFAKYSLKRPEDCEMWDGFQKGIPNGDRRFAEAYFRAEEQREIARLITFDDMLIDGVELLQTNTRIRNSVQGRYKWLIVDEAQDSNEAQIELTKLIAAPQWNVTIVGDIDQCQPAGTMVKLSGDKQIPIEKLRVGQYVAVWDKQRGRESGIRKIRRIEKRPYNGPMTTVVVGDERNRFRTRCTPNHKFTVRMNYSTDSWVVYLMYRKDLGYRVGWCKFFSIHSKGRRTYHFSKRCRLEKADKAWALKVFFNDAQASMYESIVASNYGLPLIPFEATKKATHYSQKNIETMFARLWNNEENAMKTLRCHDRLVDYPLYFPNAMERQSGSVTLETAASNLLPQVMMLPTTTNGWQPIEYTKQGMSFDQMVYSLDVEHMHVYFADDIGTNNCIYEWRGSKPKFFLEFPNVVAEMAGKTTKIVVLPKNYRSASEIIMRAADCIKNNPDRIDIPFAAHRQDPATIIFRRVEDQDDEAETILGEIRTLVPDQIKYKDIKIMMRTNAQTRALEEVFVREKIPHVILGGASFYQRKEVQDLLAYLKLMLNEQDFDAGKRAICNPFRYIAGKALKAIEYERGGHHTFIEAVEHVSHTFVRNKTRLMAFVRDMNKFRAMINEPDLNVGRFLAMIVQETNYVKFIQSSEGGDTTESSRSANIGELIRSATRFNNIEKFLEFVQWQIDILQKSRKKKNAIQISTIHKQKGLEAEAVFVIGVNAGILPHAQAPIEEERRLYYVAITRAKKYLHLTAVSSLGNNSGLQPSIFLKESRMLSEQ